MTRVEQLLEDVRAEIGNAGFAAAAGQTALANGALIEAIGQIEVVRQTLTNQKPHPPTTTAKRSNHVHQPDLHRGSTGR